MASVVAHDQHEQKRDEGIESVKISATAAATAADIRVLPEHLTHTIRSKVSAFTVEVGPNTRMDPDTGHFSDSHTRPNYSDSEYKHIFERAKAIDISEPTAEQISEFQAKGFLLLSSVIPLDVCHAISGRVDLCFDGVFDTYSYPDEWYWRKEITRPSVTRHGANVWKSDRGIATVVLNASIARFASKLMNTGGMRLGNDTLWVKPPGGNSSSSGNNSTTVSYHRDTHYVPPAAAPMATVWLTLNDVSSSNGSLEYIVGSHKWPKHQQLQRDEFLATKGKSYRDYGRAEAERLGVDVSTLEFEVITAPIGSIVIHDGDCWHGSGANVSADSWRRSIGFHLVKHNAKHTKRDGYTFGRYKLMPGTVGYSKEPQDFNESHFPIIYREDDSSSSSSSSIYRTPWLEQYLNLDGEETLELGQYPHA